MIDKLKKEDINLSEWEFEYQQRAEQPILLCDFFANSLSKYLFKNITGDVCPVDYLFTDSSKGYNVVSQKETLIKELEQKIKDKSFLQKILQDSIDIPRQFNTMAQSALVLKNDSLSNEKLAMLWEEMVEGFCKVIPWFYYPWYLSERNILTNKVKVGLEAYHEQIELISDFDEVLLAIVFPIKKTGFQLEQEEMLSLVHIAKDTRDFANNAQFKEKAKRYLQKFDWITTFILTPLLPMTYGELVKRVERAIAESFVETMVLQREASKKNTKLAQQIFSFLNDENLLKLIDDARELAWVLTAGIEEAFIASARYMPLMQQVAKRINVQFEDIKYLLSSEILEALRANNAINKDLLAERRKGFSMMTKAGTQYILFGSEGHQISQWVDTELNKIDTTLTEFKGQVACKGYAKGKVRLAVTPAQAHSLQEGEILICPMTNPDYVPAMRRSAAIVTDEGGLLSHAAIMSREFNKPCVIATKIATKLLKDGDLVEVDAEKGIVKILEKGKQVL